VNESAAQGITTSEEHKKIVKSSYDPRPRTEKTGRRCETVKLAEPTRHDAASLYSL
jgi:hypothetical protein